MPTSAPRPPGLCLRPLAPCEADSAFALMRLDTPDLSLADWRAAAAGPVAQGRVLAAWDGPLLKGLAFHSLSTGPDGAPVTRLDRLIAFDMMDPRAVAVALVAELFRRGPTPGPHGLGVTAHCDLPDQAVTLALGHGAGSLHRMI